MGDGDGAADAGVEGGAEEFGEGVGVCSCEWSGAGEAAVPAHEAEVSGGWEEALGDVAVWVSGGGAARECGLHVACEDGADDEAEAPVEEREGDGGGGGEPDGLSRGARDVDEGLEEEGDGLGGGEGVAQDEDEAHLHGECEEVPEAGLPCVDEG